VGVGSVLEDITSDCLSMLGSVSIGRLAKQFHVTRLQYLVHFSRTASAQNPNTWEIGKQYGATVQKKWKEISAKEQTPLTTSLP
jgi:hypothetical protein